MKLTPTNRLSKLKSTSLSHKNKYTIAIDDGYCCYKFTIKGLQHCSIYELAKMIRTESHKFAKGK